MWIVLKIGIVLVSAPIAIVFSYWFYPVFPEEMRWQIFYLSILTSYLPYFAWLLVSFRKIEFAPAIVMLGALIRLTALGGLYFWIRPLGYEFISPGLMQYLFLTGSFLLFEIVSLVVFRRQIHEKM